MARRIVNRLTTQNPTRVGTTWSSSPSGRQFIRHCRPLRDLDRGRLARNERVGANEIFPRRGGFRWPLFYLFALRAYCGRDARDPKALRAEMDRHKLRRLITVLNLSDHRPATFEYMTKDSAGRAATILIVEDTDWIRSGMKHAAEQYGYLVMEAKDELEAVEVAEHQAPDLILTEERLPDLPALVARIRAHPALQQLPIVIIDPDATEGARVGDVMVVPDYDRLAPLIITPPHLN